MTCFVFPFFIWTTFESSKYQRRRAEKFHLRLGARNTLSSGWLLYYLLTWDWDNEERCTYAFAGINNFRLSPSFHRCEWVTEELNCLIDPNPIFCLGYIRPQWLNYIPELPEGIRLPRYQNLGLIFGPFYTWAHGSSILLKSIFNVIPVRSK